MRIAISGSYSTGKTITTMVLSEVTNIPKTHALTMRELLPVVFPNKKLEQCRPHELVELIIRRNYERLKAETEIGDNFISDGASIQEWAYCYARLKTGFNPNEKKWKSIINKYMHYPKWKVFQEIMDSFGTVVKKHSVDNYDYLFHLPIEFPFDPDGHRPTSERFRRECDSLLKYCYKEIGINVIEISGSINERITKICNIFQFPLKDDLDIIIKKCIEKKKYLFDKVPIER